MTNTSQKTHFHVEERNRRGKQANQLLSEGKIPGNIYGLGRESQAVKMPRTDFMRLYAEEGDTGVVYLSVGDTKKEVPVMIDEVAYHPVTAAIQHVVFRRVDLKQSITAEIPVTLEGENKVPDTNVLLVTDTIEVSALPEDLPEEFVVNIESLTEAGQSITYGDLTYDRSKVQIVFAGEETAESPVVLLQEMKEEVPEEPVVEDAQAGAEGATETPAAQTEDTASAATQE